MRQGSVSLDRSLLLVTLLTLAGFQSHWLDDAFTGGPDLAGGLVSAAGSALLIMGLLRRKRRAGRVVLALGFLFVALVSMADLSGLGVEGAFAPDVVAHWRDGLGWGWTLVVLATLLAAFAGMALLNRRGAAP